MRHGFEMALCVVLLLTSSLVALADDEIDVYLHNASPADILSLRNITDAKIRQMEEWEEVNVPVGIYQVGNDIPVGKWTVSAGTPSTWCRMLVGDVLADNGKEVDFFNSSSWFDLDFASEWLYEDLPFLHSSAVSIDLQEGYYIEVSRGSVLFTPYHGNPNFVFFAEVLPESKVSNDLLLIDEMSFDDLVSLKNRLNAALWKSYDWDRVLVPCGIYRIGIGIPEGHWNIEPPSGSYIAISYGDSLNDLRMNMELSYSSWKQSLCHLDSEFYDEGDVEKTDVNMELAYYACVSGGVYAWFSPSGGDSSLGFKAFGGSSSDQSSDDNTNLSEFIIDGELSIIP